jgi:hypothetical protein
MAGIAMSGKKCGKAVQMAQCVVRNNKEILCSKKSHLAALQKISLSLTHTPSPISILHFHFKSKCPQSDAYLESKG